MSVQVVDHPLAKSMLTALCVTGTPRRPCSGCWPSGWPSCCAWKRPGRMPDRADRGGDATGPHDGCPAGPAAGGGARIAGRARDARSGDRAFPRGDRRVRGPGAGPRHLRALSLLLQAAPAGGAGRAAARPDAGHRRLGVGRLRRAREGGRRTDHPPVGGVCPRGHRAPAAASPRCHDRHGFDRRGPQPATPTSSRAWATSGTACSERSSRDGRWDHRPSGGRRSQPRGLKRRPASLAVFETAWPL